VFSASRRRGGVWLARLVGVWLPRLFKRNVLLAVGSEAGARAGRVMGFVG
jgi:hypothetical protein